MNYSILDLAYVMKGDTFTQTFEKSALSIQLAEDLGYTRYWVSEHHNMANVISSATSILIGYLASKTKKIRVGSGGIMLPNHTTLSVAEQFGTLDAMYPNRIDLGLGRAPGTDALTAQRLRRGILDYNYPFEQHIEELELYFSIENAQSKVRALPGEGANVPLYMLGSSTDSAYLSAKLGLPYAFAGHFAPAQFFAAHKIYHENFQPSERLAKPYMLLCANFILADTVEEAHYLSKTMYQSFANIVTDHRKPIVSPEETSLENLSKEQLAVVQNMTAFSFVGDIGTVKSDLEQFLRPNPVDEIIVSTNIYNLQKKLHSYQLTAEVFNTK
ncbi:LLM class flavin-dependent oxidoreductase [Weeksella virosa]|uniref:Luciferase-like monooxygenase n=1 Tax=Weeksella virosa (strain ATCC 43766 / DSM 16922 / JCM 21250 / CCUG 30538 / CDC 9751 / IAM 14551 / NBRC 16016 / NCTC 11634 / CL345/78) TaxID=865938 RepID=F0P1S4_WEEVC|nr:LLM class flavin-dependent oxidoreductase [Weeksella virosa]ADX68721.1 luciferase family oxidoreductase, group 1 [Weeksella virosa DSM 16922]MDK7375114.1 LLM class flavin-dependent oxidoreductase [Weeksella virosa]MDK7675861.1 LLM class flavin-dependent oxidoreductase [Weeksella virosa]SUP55071.1 Limonene 1,2-monooxygenase [Weeksella virosa]VEH63608.1 Limonene 1,2-monooxygenase [Weeksella virosa]